MSLGDLEDLTRTRTLLECAAVRDSIQLGDDEWEARVVSAYHKLSRAEERLAQDPVGLFDEWEERNRDFHQALTSACPSRSPPPRPSPAPPRRSAPPPRGPRRAPTPPPS